MYYSIISVTPTDDTWVQGYLEAVTPLVSQHGGQYLARTASHERLEGEGDNPAVQVIIEWPSKDHAVTFMNDPVYAPLLQARSTGSISHHFLVEGKDDAA